MEKTTINVAELAKEVATESGMTQKTVKEVFAALDTVVKASLAQANEENAVEIKVLPGLVVKSFHVDETTARNPMTGEPVTVPAKNRVTAKVMPSLKTAANEED